MSNNQTPSSPVLIEDLGMQYATESSKQKSHFAIFKCYCGIEFKARIAAIKNGTTKSCGCYQKSMASKANTSHGLRNHKLYGVWSDIIRRTENKNRPDYEYYGGRGIVVCLEWRNNFMSFYEWAFNNGYKEGLTIDRINNNGNYEPSNCRWVSRIVQSRNTRKLNSKNKTGFRGVCVQYGKFCSRINVNNIRIHLGYFNNAIEAAKAYDTYVIENNLEHTINGVTYQQQLEAPKPIDLIANMAKDKQC